MNEESVEHRIDVEDRFSFALTVSAILMFALSAMVYASSAWFEYFGYMCLTVFMAYCALSNIKLSIDLRHDYRTLQGSPSPVISFNGKHAFCNGEMLRTIHTLERCEEGYDWDAESNTLTVPFRCDFVTMYDMEE